jgi:hypothetical protein
MKTFLKWFLYGLAVFLVAFCVAIPLFGGGVMFNTHRVLTTGWGMHGGMMDDWGFPGWIGLCLRLAVPVLILGLLTALGIILFRRKSAEPVPPPPAPVPTAACPRCGKPVDNGWVACPFCAKKL